MNVLFVGYRRDRRSHSVFRWASAVNGFTTSGINGWARSSAGARRRAYVYSTSVRPPPLPRRYA